MRAIALDADAIVVTSRLWQTTATALRRGAEAVLIDSPYFPDELELLPTLLAQSGFEPTGLLATHADFDHLLGRLAFPQLPLGVGQATAEALRAAPGTAQRELRDADARHYVARPAPLSVGSYQPLPEPGYIALGDTEIEIHPTAGHTGQGSAFFSQATGILIVGDYLSDVEIPTLSTGGTLHDYRSTLSRLATLVERAATVVTGHGAPQDRDGARRLLDEDAAYLDALESGAERPRLPRGRASAYQRELHRANLTRI
ncbi:MAG: MBL fold metallo-hydrolase [Thermoleophilaceae bacterium]